MTETEGNYKAKRWEKTLNQCKENKKEKTLNIRNIWYIHFNFKSSIKSLKEQERKILQKGKKEDRL